MRLELTGRHIDITPTLRKLVTRKLGRLERLLNDSAVGAHLVLTQGPRLRRAVLTLHARGEKFLHATGEGTTWAIAIGRAVEKAAQQAAEIKGKWEEWKRRGTGLTLREGEM
jgi:ribosomal subunit interface protein